MEGYLGTTTPDVTPYDDWGPAEWAMEYVSRYGGIDGAHHKQWVLDEVARILHGTPVIVTLASWDSGQTEWRFTTGATSAAYWAWRSEDEDWDEGVAP